MVAESLFHESPRDFCILVQTLEEEYADLPLYVIYFHQFAVNEVADLVERNVFTYFVDAYTADIFPELDGYEKLSIILGDDGFVESYQLYKQTVEA